MKSIYLKPEEITVPISDDWQKYPTIESISKALNAVMEASADNAVRVIIEWLADPRRLQDNPSKCYLELHRIHWQHLKKLIETKK